MTPAAAEQMRDAVLAAQRYPQAVTEQSQGFGMSRGRLGYSGANESLSATLYGVGWWQTLGWRYASTLSGNASATEIRSAVPVIQRCWPNRRNTTSGLEKR